MFEYKDEYKSRLTFFSIWLLFRYTRRLKDLHAELVMFEARMILVQDEHDKCEQMLKVRAVAQVSVTMIGWRWLVDQSCNLKTDWLTD